MIDWARMSHDELCEMHHAAEATVWRILSRSQARIIDVQAKIEAEKIAVQIEMEFARRRARSNIRKGCQWV